MIEPGQAFGTGAHATTRLCLELLLAESAPASGSFIDLGCGSGVLAIAAARLGYAPVCALDNDPAAVAATAENARVNGVDVDVRRFDLREEPVPRGEVVAANLLGPLLVRHAAAIGAHARRVIASGLLATERNRVAEAFAAGGYHVADERRGAEWAALLLARSSAAIAG